MSYRQPLGTNIGPGTDGVYDYIALAPGADPDTVLFKLKPILESNGRSERIGWNARQRL